VKGLFSFAFKKGYLKLPADPMEKVSYTPPEGNKRDDFTIDERRRILTAALEADPTVKWLTFLSAFELTRTSEIADCDTRDFVLVDGIWVHKIQRKYRSEDQRLKTKPSTRDMPLHSGILNAGFIPYLQSLPPGPLFASLRLDSYGKRATHASKITNKWLREVVGINDPTKPFYSLRHSGITDLRFARTANGEIAVKQNVEMYLTAHAKKDVHGGYGEYPAHEFEGRNRVGQKPIIGPSSTRRGPGLAPVAGMMGSGQIQTRQRNSRQGIEGRSGRPMLAELLPGLRWQAGLGVCRYPIARIHLSALLSLQETLGI
jgi:hypothetical protein